MTKRKVKESVNTLEGWSEIIKAQGERLSDRFENERQLNIQREEDLNKCAELFHKLWGEAHDSPQYNKESWVKMQILLDKLGIPA